MKKPAAHIATLEKAAKRLGVATKQIHPLGETMLGRTIHFSSKNKFCIVSSKKTGFYPNTSVWFKILCNCKHTSNLILQKHGYKTIPSVFFDTNKFSDKKHIATQINLVNQFPVICKPEEGFKGQGIKTIYNQAQLRKVLRQFTTTQQSFLVQPIILDTEYRVLVIENRVFVAHTKALPTITGNGKSTIQSLLQTAIDTPQDPEFIKATLKQRGFTANTILDLGDTLPVHITRKGGSLLYTKDAIPTPIQKWAKQLCKDLQTQTLGIDVFIPTDFSDVQNYQIIEINASPGFTYLESRYKQKALVQEIAEHILQSYFKL